MWKTVKANHLKNKGLNVWIYEPDGKIFAGVELEEVPVSKIGLEQKNITLTNYAYSKHMGPYHLIKQKVHAMKDHLKENGYRIVPLYLEIYGHWTDDESKLETELLQAIAKE